jgi:hypothetical protein
MATQPNRNRDRAAFQRFRDAVFAVREDAAAAGQADVAASLRTVQNSLESPPRSFGLGETRSGEAGTLLLRAADTLRALKVGLDVTADEMDAYAAEHFGSARPVRPASTESSS